MTDSGVESHQTTDGLKRKMDEKKQNKTKFTTRFTMRSPWSILFTKTPSNPSQKNIHPSSIISIMHHHHNHHHSHHHHHHHHHPHLRISYHFPKIPPQTSSMPTNPASQTELWVWPKPAINCILYTRESLQAYLKSCFEIPLSVCPHPPASHPPLPSHNPPPLPPSLSQ